MLEMLPSSIGGSIYHWLQNLKGPSLEAKVNSSYSTYSQLTQIADKNGFSFTGKKIVEIGSGWLPLLPYFLKYEGGAREVNTYDLNRHYQKNKIFSLNHFFEERFKKKIVCIDHKYGLPEGIFYYPNTNIAGENLGEADIIFSRFVLEHVTPEALLKMHLHFRKQLDPGTHIIHFISPSDHRAYDDNTLSLQDFLRYSEKEWNRIQTRFDYHNRWRLPQYISLFHKLGFEIVHLEYDFPDRTTDTYKKFEAVPLHSDFQHYTEEELIAGSINIVLKV